MSVERPYILPEFVDRQVITLHGSPTRAKIYVGNYADGKPFLCNGIRIWPGAPGTRFAWNGSRWVLLAPYLQSQKARRRLR